MPSERPKARFEHIVENCARIRRYLAGIDEPTFLSDTMLQDAVERCLQRISEAARVLGPIGPHMYPHLDWRAMIGFGNVSRHDYEDVDTRLLWAIVQGSIEPLARAAEDAIGRLPPDPV